MTLKKELCLLRFKEVNLEEVSEALLKVVIKDVAKRAAAKQDGSQ